MGVCFEGNDPFRLVQTETKKKATILRFLFFDTLDFLLADSGLFSTSQVNTSTRIYRDAAGNSVRLTARACLFVCVCA